MLAADRYAQRDHESSLLTVPVGRPRSVSVPLIDTASFSSPSTSLTSLAGRNARVIERNELLNLNQAVGKRDSLYLALFIIGIALFIFSPLLVMAYGPAFPIAAALGFSLILGSCYAKGCEIKPATELI